MGTRSSFISHTPARIQIDGDERWIDIKPKLGQGDRLDLIDKLIDIKALGNAKGGSVSVTKYGAFVNTLLAMSIVDWHLTDDTGADVPFSVDLIANLEPDDPLTEKVTQEVVERNPLGVKRTPGASK